MVSLGHNVTACRIRRLLAYIRIRNYDCGAGPQPKIKPPTPRARAMESCWTAEDGSQLSDRRPVFETTAECDPHHLPRPLDTLGWSIRGSRAFHRPQRTVQLDRTRRHPGTTWRHGSQPAPRRRPRGGDAGMTATGRTPRKAPQATLQRLDNTGWAAQPQNPVVWRCSPILGRLAGTRAAVVITNRPTPPTGTTTGPSAVWTVAGSRLACSVHRSPGIGRGWGHGATRPATYCAHRYPAADPRRIAASIDPPPSPARQTMAGYPAPLPSAISSAAVLMAPHRRLAPPHPQHLPQHIGSHVPRHHPRP